MVSSFRWFAWISPGDWFYGVDCKIWASVGAGRAGRSLGKSRIATATKIEDPAVIMMTKTIGMAKHCTAAGAVTEV
jgi:hypothetical protein